MRILYLCQSVDGMDGWATYTKHLADGMRERGHEVKVCDAQSLAEGLQLPPPLQMLTRPWKAFFLARTVTSLCNSWKPDIIHVTVEPYALVTPFLPRKWQERMVLTAHGSYGVRPLQERWTRPLALRTYRNIAACITVSQYTKDVVAAELQARGIKEDVETFNRKTTVIHNAVALPEQLMTKKPVTLKTILCVGGVKPRKGILEAVEACALYKQTYDTPFRFIIIGKAQDHDYVRIVQECIAQHGLRDQVILRGAVPQEELDRAYAEADLYLMPAKTTPSTFEGFGIVFLEANARGIPCIGPVTSGAAEAIAEGRSGFRVDPENPRDIAERMHRILDEHAIDPSACIAWAKEHNLQAQVQAVEDVYKHIIRK